MLGSQLNDYQALVLNAARYIEKNSKGRCFYKHEIVGRDLWLTYNFYVEYDGGSRTRRFKPMRVTGYRIFGSDKTLVGELEEAMKG